MTKYTFRQLTSTDIFPVCNIISKIGIRELKSCLDTQNLAVFAAQGGKKNKSAIMALGASVAFANMQKCEAEIFTFLASVTDLTEDDLRTMPPADFADIIINFFKKEELGDFISVVSKFIK